VVIREHLIRYVMALDSVAGKDVLDVACGSGYGMFLMSYLAKSVSGYDYDKEL
jgi:protein-L-isoaspartate O-methyltransferase